jgi:RimJ/RimL family protein N-acetyltransferase
MIETKRLLLRSWRDADLGPFAQLNADPNVYEFFGKGLSAGESAALVKDIQEEIDQQGFGLWALELKETKAFIGCTGLSVPEFTAHFTPCVEIAWRLAVPYWGRGYATEAALAALEYGFHTIGLKEIVAFTAPQNVRSRAVMKRIGMTCDAQGDFNHPLLPEGHPLQRHVLYRAHQ